MQPGLLMNTNVVVLNQGIIPQSPVSLCGLGASVVNLLTALLRSCWICTRALSNPTLANMGLVSLLQEHQRLARSS